MQININWAGVLVERISGLKLNDYLKKYILEPLSLKNINMFQSKEMKAQLASMHQRAKGGFIEERDRLCRRPLTAETEEEQVRIFNSGGGSCFIKPVEYCRKLSTLSNRTQAMPPSDYFPEILATLLNDGTSRLLAPKFCLRRPLPQCGRTRSLANPTSPWWTAIRET